MAILVALISSVVTGMLVALVGYAMGVYRQDILLALAIMGGGIELGALILWYLLAHEAWAAKADLERKRSGAGDANRIPRLPLAR
jgi:prepilin signal peptidase PulO-like enzyme (type II secretory pathway)